MNCFLALESVCVYDCENVFERCMTAPTSMCMLNKLISYYSLFFEWLSFHSYTQGCLHSPGSIWVL